MASLREIKGNLFLLSFLAALLTVSLAYCPGHHSHETCSLLYSALESALLDNSSVSTQNLYNLREEFFPSSHSPPEYGDVRYNIVTTADFALPNKLCNGAENITVVKNLNGSDRLFVWSYSGLLAKLDPYMLSFYQLEILSYVFGAVGIIDYWFDPNPPKAYYIVLNLTLELVTLPCAPTEAQLRSSLQDLTSWLKVYAKAQGRPTALWDINDKRYAVDQKKEDSGTDYHILFANYIFLSALVTTALWGLSPRAYKAVASRAADSDSFCFRFWGTAIVAMLCNFVTIIFEPVVIVKYLVINPQWAHIPSWALVFGYTKLIEMFLFLATDFVLALLIVTALQKDTYYPVPTLLDVMADMYCCCRFVTTRQHVHKFHQLIAIWSVLFFVHTVAIGMVPTMLWVFIQPIKMLLVVTITIATLFSLSIFMAAMFSLLPLVRIPPPLVSPALQTQASQLDSSIRGKCSVMLQMLLILQLCVTVTLTFVLYLNLVTTEIDTNKPTSILASFVPTALLTIVGWLVTTRAWQAFTDEQTDSTPQPRRLQRLDSVPPTEHQNSERRTEVDDDEELIDA